MNAAKAVQLPESWRSQVQLGNENKNGSLSILCFLRFFAAKFWRSAFCLPRQNLPQHEGQNAAVAVVVDLDGRIDAHDHRHG